MRVYGAACAGSCGMGRATERNVLVVFATLEAGREQTCYKRWGGASQGLRSPNEHAASTSHRGSGLQRGCEGVYDRLCR